MKNVNQLNYRELHPAEANEINGGWWLSFALLVADTALDMIEDPNCGCGGGNTYYP